MVQWMAADDSRELLELVVDWYEEFEKPWRYRDDIVWRELWTHQLVEIDMDTRSVWPTERGINIIHRSRNQPAEGGNGQHA